MSVMGLFGQFVYLTNDKTQPQNFKIKNYRVQVHIMLMNGMIIGFNMLFSEILDTRL